jgi:hypothetical protein
MARCEGCGRELNPVAVMLGPVCGACVRVRHAEVTGDARAALDRARRAWSRTQDQLALEYDQAEQFAPLLTDR